MVPTVPPGPTQPTRRPFVFADELATTALLSTIVLFAYMLYLAISPLLPSFAAANGPVTEVMRDRISIVLALYMMVQLLETVLRKSNQFAVFAADNLLALSVLFLSIGIVVAQLFVSDYNLTPDQKWILIECSIWDFIDLFIGVMATNRIAFSGKERDED